MEIKNFIGKGLKDLVPGSPNLNVINIIRSLIEDPECICYIPTSYSKEKETNTDSRVHFNPIEAGKTISATAIQSNQERFNFSLTGDVPVFVEYEQENGNIKLVPKKVFRTYTIIRDGELTIDYIIAKLSEETFNDLRNAGVLYYNGVPVADNHLYVKDFLYKIMLKDIPVISLAWAQPVQIGLYQNMELENKLSNTLKELNKLIKKYKEEGQTGLSDENSEYYNETWNGASKVGNKKLVECITYEIKNDNIVDDEIISNSVNLITATINKHEVNKQLRAVRFINRCVIMAIEKSKYKGNYDWSEMYKVPRTKNKMAQTCNIVINDKSYELKRVVYNKEF